jgi:hypothetical protein
MLGDGLPGIGRAGGVIPAAIAQKRGQRELVDPDQEKRGGLHDAIRLRCIVVNAEI